MTRALEGATLAKEAAFLACVSASPTMLLPFQSISSLSSSESDR